MTGEQVDAVEKTGFLATVMQKVKDFFAQFDFQQWLDNMRSTTAGTAVLFFGAGFAIGFLFKKYFKFLFGCILVTSLFLLFLYYNSVITFDWPALYRALCIDPAQVQVDTFLGMYWEWVKANVLVTVSTLIGFIVGYKLG